MTVRRIPGGVVEFWNGAVHVGSWVPPKLDDADVFGLAARHWGLGWRSVVACAIAFGESNGYAGALGDLDRVSATWGPSVGLWQIRTSPEAVTAMTDPEANAQRAYEMWSKRGWKPWGAYTSAAYLRQMVRARNARARFIARTGDR